MVADKAQLDLLSPDYATETHHQALDEQTNPETNNKIAQAETLLKKATAEAKERLEKTQAKIGVDKTNPTSKQKTMQGKLAEINTALTRLKATTGPRFNAEQARLRAEAQKLQDKLDKYQSTLTTLAERKPAAEGDGQQPPIASQGDNKRLSWLQKEKAKVQEANQNISAATPSSSSP